MNTNLKKALFLTTLGYLQANEGFLAIMPDENKQEDISQEQKLEHKMEQKIAPQNTLKKQQSAPLQSAELLQSQVKREVKEQKKSQKHLVAMQTKNGFFLGSEIAITGTSLKQSLSFISNTTDDLLTYSKTSKNANFKPPKQKSQISLVFGMNALVPLGTL
ncbi:hypothetical protein HMPREF1409_00004 [Helicobacter pylori GAM246Ai]|nr:hypothetical protein HMPREF1409_00004 [Helicobacter pylori GAM246Ai]